MIKIIRNIIVCVFFMTIAVPFIGRYMIAGSTPDKVLATENRKVVPFPKLWRFRHHDIKRYFKDVDQYISDRLARKDWVVSTVNSFLLAPDRFFSMDYSKGVYGTDGFLFMGDDYDHVISRHFKGVFPKTEMQINNLIARHRSFQIAAKNVGSDYIVFIAPDKHGIYCENFPAWLKNVSCARVGDVSRDFVGQFRSLGIPTVYPFDDLRSRNREFLYFRADTHWNWKGAEIGFDVLMKTLEKSSVFCKSQPFVRFTEYQLKKVPNTVGGDLVVIMGLSSHRYKVNDVNYVFERPVIDVLWSEMGQKFKVVPVDEARSNGADPSWSGVSLNPRAPNRQKVLIFCDSFMTAMSAFFNMNFAEVHYISRHHPQQVLMAKIREVKPDVVVDEQVERFFH